MQGYCFPVFLIELIGYTALYSDLFPVTLYNQHFPHILQKRTAAVCMYWLQIFQLAQFSSWPPKL